MSGMHPRPLSACLLMAQSIRPKLPFGFWIVPIIVFVRDNEVLFEMAKSADKELVYIEGANHGETVSLDQAPLLIGRGPDAQIRLDDDYVSTRHARIASSGDQWYVEDLGSTNGTYVGTSRITQPTALQLGTQVRIGKTILELRK